MYVEEIVGQCLQESGAKGYAQSRVLTLVGLASVPDGDIDKKELRRRMKTAYVQAGEERGFVFMAIILPLLISLISNWIVKWIWDRTNRSEIRTEAAARLCELSPRWMGTLTSTSTHPNSHTGQQE